MGASPSTSSRRLPKPNRMPLVDDPTQCERAAQATRHAKPARRGDVAQCRGEAPPGRIERKGLVRGKRSHAEQEVFLGSRLRQRSSGQKSRAPRTAEYRHSTMVLTKRCWEEVLGGSGKLFHFPG